MQFVRIVGNTRRNWHEVTAEIRDAISNAGGWIIDFQFFSNLSLSLHFELLACNVGRLIDSLFQLGIRITPESMIVMQQIDPHAPTDIKGSLQITFIHNEPDLLRAVPAFS